MPTRLRKADLFVVVAATGWSVSLVMAGFASIVVSTRVPAFTTSVLSAGLALVAAGNVVFLAGVADRAFRNASKPLVAWLELLSCVILFSGLGVALLALFLPRLFS
jgi:uncharacterized membrane protein YphA (DoxX/SURF4 family)